MKDPLIKIPLIIWLALTVFSILFGNVPSISQVGVKSQTWSINISDTELITSAFIGLAVIVAIIGLEVFGSGLDSESVRMIISIIFYAGLWAIFLELSIPLIRSIEIYGWVIDIMLSLLFLIGIGIKTFGGGS